MKKQSPTDWTIVASIGLIGVLSILWYQRRPRQTYGGIANAVIVSSNAPMQERRVGEIPFRLHSTVRAKIRAEITNSELTIRIPLSPEMERKGLRVSVEHQTNL